MRARPLNLWDFRAARTTWSGHFLAACGNVWRLHAHFWPRRDFFFSMSPPRAEYMLTDKGRDLGPIVAVQVGCRDAVTRAAVKKVPDRPRDRPRRPFHGPRESVQWFRRLDRLHGAVAPGSGSDKDHFERRLACQGRNRPA